MRIDSNEVNQERFLAATLAGGGRGDLARSACRPPAQDPELTETVCPGVFPRKSQSTVATPH